MNGNNYNTLAAQKISMKKSYLFINICISTLLGTAANAQMPYTFSYATDTYVPLTVGTSLNGTHIWDSYSDEYYTAPIGFNFTIDKVTIDKCFLYTENSMTTDTVSTDTSKGFGFIDGDLIDRGRISGTASLSPIRYTVTGTPGSRIFKLEIANAGFYAEYDSLGTLNDSVNVQEWLYEGTNVVELRYGPSKISYPSTYFSISGMPLVGYIDAYYPSSASKIFILSGDPTRPTIDSIIMGAGGFPTHLGNPLNSFPPNGMVYRFTPKTTSVNNLALENSRIYPTAAQNEIMIDYNAGEPAKYTVVSVSGSNTNISGTLQRGTAHINIADLPAGIYLLKLENSYGRSTKKFVKL